MDGGIQRSTRSGCALAWLAVLLILTTSTGLAEDVQKSAPASKRGLTAEMRDLFLTESISFSTPAPLLMIPKTKCDLKGNIYLVQSGTPPGLLGFTNGLSTIPLSKLSIDSKSTVAYPVPRLDRYRGVVRLDFDVSADGHLYSLLEALDASSSEREPPPAFFIAKYHDDGSLDSYFKLGDAPERRLQPLHFSMFGDGSVLVTGTSVGREGLRPFIAVLDSSGRFVTYVKASHDAEPEKPGKYETPDDYAVTLASNSFVVDAPDGNVYLLRGDEKYRLYVVPSGGEIIKEFEVPITVPGLKATNMGMAGDDKVFIAFARVEGGGPSPTDANSDAPKNLITVISPQTGKVSAVYRLPAEADAFDIPACAVSSDSFLFVGSTADRQHQQVKKYLPR